MGVNTSFGYSLFERIGGKEEVVETRRRSCCFSTPNLAVSSLRPSVIPVWKISIVYYSFSSLCHIYLQDVLSRRQYPVERRLRCLRPRETLRRRDTRSRSTEMPRQVWVQNYSSSLKKHSFHVYVFLSPMHLHTVTFDRKVRIPSTVLPKRSRASPEEQKAKVLCPSHMANKQRYHPLHSNLRTQENPCIV